MIDPRHDEAADAQADAQSMFDEMGATPFDYNTPESMDGSLGALKGFLRPSAGAGRTLLMAGAPFAIAADKAKDFASDVSDVAGSIASGGTIPVGAENNSTAIRDSYFKNVVDDVGGNAVEAWTPDPVTMSGTAKAINMVSNVAGSIPQIFGAPELFLANAGMDPAIEVVRQGGDSNTALAVGGVNLAVNALGMKLPASIGGSLATRMASGAGINLAAGAASDVANAEILKAGGYDSQAEGYDVTDPYARGMDVLMGLAFGIPHNDVHITPAQRDAVLVARNAEHMERQSMPGLPLMPDADTRHLTAVGEALQQMAKGEKVDVSATIRPEDFMLKRDPADSGSGFPITMNVGGFAGALSRVMGDEGGRVNDPVDRGGDTKFGISSRAHPGVDLNTLTKAGAAKIYKAEYWDAIGADTLPAGLQGVAFDAAVNQGVGWAKAALREAGGDTGKFIALREARYREIVATDPTQAKFLRGWLNRLGRYKETNPAGEALRERLVQEPEQLASEYVRLKDSAGGTILNTDLARELSPEYLADRTRSADVHEAASDVVKTLYEQKLAQPTPVGFDRAVLFTAGGTGAGKTTAINAAGEAFGKPEIVYDTNMNTLASAVDKVEQALAAGREVDIAYVYREPVEALTGGAIPRAQHQAKQFGSGRTVPLSEHARTHTGVRPVMEALAEKYRGDDRVRIRAIDNSRGQYQAAIVPLESLPRVEDNQLHERLQAALDEARTGGLDEATYRGFTAEGRTGNQGRASNSPRPSDGGRAQQGAGQQVNPADGKVSPTIKAAAQAVLKNPDARVVVGSDADGNPIIRTAAEESLDIAAERAQSIRDAEGIPAAVACFLRLGVS